MAGVPLQTCEYDKDRKSLTIRNTDGAGNIIYIGNHRGIEATGAMQGMPLPDAQTATYDKDDPETREAKFILCAVNSTVFVQENFGVSDQGKPLTEAPSSGYTFQGHSSGWWHK